MENLQIRLFIKNKTKTSYFQEYSIFRNLSRLFCGSRKKFCCCRDKRPLGRLLPFILSLVGNPLFSADTTIWFSLFIDTPHRINTIGFKLLNTVTHLTEIHPKAIGKHIKTDCQCLWVLESGWNGCDQVQDPVPFWVHCGWARDAGHGTSSPPTHQRSASSHN